MEKRGNLNLFVSWERIIVRAHGKRSLDTQLARFFFCSSLFSPSLFIHDSRLNLMQFVLVFPIEKLQDTSDFSAVFRMTKINQFVITLGLSPMENQGSRRRRRRTRLKYSVVLHTRGDFGHDRVGCHIQRSDTHSPAEWKHIHGHTPRSPPPCNSYSFGLPLVSLPFFFFPILFSISFFSRYLRLQQFIGLFAYENWLLRKVRYRLGGRSGVRWKKVTKIVDLKKNFFFKIAENSWFLFFSTFELFLWHF